MLRTIFLWLTCVCVSLAGCTADEAVASRAGGPTLGTVGSGSPDAGTVGMHLTLPAGLTVFDIAYTISGPHTYAGTVHVGSAQSIEFTVGGVLAGDGYSVTLTATDSAGDPCSGTSDPFRVVAGATTSAVVVMQCVQTGTLGIGLTLGSGASIVDIDFSIQGPHDYTGTVHIGAAPSIEFTIGGIAAGTGYNITLRGVDTSGDTCSGTSSLFDVVGGQTTPVQVILLCQVANDASAAADVTTGSVSIDAGIAFVDAGGAVDCPGISGFAVTPAEVLVGQAAALSITTVGPAPVIAWSVQPAGAGNFGPDAASAAPSFTCASAGVVTVTVKVDLASGRCAGLPFTSLSAPIRCEGGDGGT